MPGEEVPRKGLGSHHPTALPAVGLIHNYQTTEGGTLQGGNTNPKGRGVDPWALGAYCSGVE